MAAATPSCTLDLLDLLKKSRIWPESELESRLEAIPPVPDEPSRAAAHLIKHGLLTTFQARVLLTGKYRGFRLGAYVIRDQIGQGGMGSVFLAQHETLRRPVAIKVLAAGEKGATSKVNVERFLREARSAAALDHPNIVRIFDVAQLGETHYLVMEYVEGQTLDQMLTAGGPVACGRAVEYVLQAAAGLEHASQKGFIHRDIKPANLILAKDGTLKILDMGLARSEETEDQVTEVFDKGAVVGTADFISPEQAMNASDLDIRTDIYSLGATFYTLVTGKPPFRGNTTQKLMQHQIKDAPALDSLDKTFPPDLSRVVAKMMKKRPADRYQTPGEVMAALGPWLSNTSHVVAALSRTESRSSIDLQQTLTEVVSGSTKRLPSVIATGDRKIPALPLPYVIAGLATVAFGLLVLGGLAVYALSGSAEKSNVVARQSAAPVPTPMATPAPAPNPGLARPPLGNRQPVAGSDRQLPKRGPVYEFNPESLAIFREQWRTTRSKTNPGALETTVLGNSGDGALPEGWERMNYGAVTVSEIAIDSAGGAKAFGLTTLEGERTTMIFAAPFKSSAANLKLRIEYMTEGSLGDGYLKFRQTLPASDANGWEVGKLPATSGQWTTSEFPLDGKMSKMGQLEFHTGWLELGKMLWIKSVVVTEDQGEKVTALPAGSKVLFRSKFDALEPFRETSTTADNDQKQKVSKVSDRAGTGDVPADWLFMSWNAETVQECTAALRKGTTAFGIRTVRGEPTTMLLSPDIVFPGPRIRVRVEYAIDGDTGESFVKLRQKAPEVLDARVVSKLPASAGEWQTADFELDQRDATAGSLEFHTYGLPLGETVWLKSIVVYEVAK